MEQIGTNWNKSSILAVLLFHKFVTLAQNSVQNYVQILNCTGKFNNMLIIRGFRLFRFVPSRSTSDMRKSYFWHTEQRSTFYKNKSKERREFIKNVYTRARGCAAQIFGNSEQLERLKNGSLQNTKNTLSNRT